MKMEAGNEVLRKNRLGIIYGAEDIAAFLGMTRRQVYKACERHHMPHFRIGATICMRQATLARWIDAQERTAISVEVDPVADALPAEDTVTQDEVVSCPPTTSKP